MFSMSVTSQALILSLQLFQALQYNINKLPFNRPFPGQHGNVVKDSQQNMSLIVNTTRTIQDT